MDTPTTIADAIQQQALDGVSSFSVDGMSTTALPIADLIAADRYRAAKAAQSRNHHGIAFVKLNQPGTV